MREAADGLFVRIRHVAMKVVMESASPKSFVIIISRTSLQERMGAAVFHEHMEDISAALHHEESQTDVRSARYPLRGKEEAEYRWQTRRRRSSLRSRICRTQGMSPSIHSLETDTMAAIRDNDITAEGETENWIVWMRY